MYMNDGFRCESSTTTCTQPYILTRAHTQGKPWSTSCTSTCPPPRGASSRLPLRVPLSVVRRVQRALLQRNQRAAAAVVQSYCVSLSSWLSTSRASRVWSVACCRPHTSAHQRYVSVRPQSIALALFNTNQNLNPGQDSAQRTDDTGGHNTRQQLTRTPNTPQPRCTSRNRRKSVLSRQQQSCPADRLSTDLVRT